MAITTGAQLATAIANWMQRVDLSSRIPEFVSLAEAKLFRELRTPEMETKDAAFSITGEYVAVPTGMLEVRQFNHNSAGADYQPIVYLSPDIESMKMPSGSGIPRYFSIVGGNFRFSPVPDATYTATLVYFKAPTTCSTGSTEHNWILDAHPDVYLYGSLLEAEAFVGDDPRIQMWASAYGLALSQLKKQGSRMRWGGNSMTTRPG